LVSGLGADPAIRFNLFKPWQVLKRIFTTIGAKGFFLACGGAFNLFPFSFGRTQTEERGSANTANKYFHGELKETKGPRAARPEAKGRTGEAHLD
jgi:hypothetical protein